MRASVLVALSCFSLVALGCTKVTKVTHTYYGYVRKKTHNLHMIRCLTKST
jgi:hypothetical protein